jgi:DNA invertase Pin-like site-specific DNA recombinase
MKVALYMRLSKEDGCIQTESNSISNQRLLLHDAMKEKFPNDECVEYVDDGYSGINTNRPAYQAMLLAITQGEIDCLMVKDFSRFSRDYIEMGDFLEHRLSFWGIRFISLGDHYDSDTSSLSQLGTRFKTLLYDLYSKDLSVKIKSALSSRKEEGHYAFAQVSFGYEKCESDSQILRIVPQEAEIIRRIFTWASQGWSSVRIARALNSEGIKTPRVFRAKNNSNKMIREKAPTWTNSGVCRILSNPVYCGDMVYHKTFRPQVGGTNQCMERSRFSIHPNHHEAIVDRNLYEMVQTQMHKPRRNHLMRKPAKCGRLRHVYCGECHKALRLRLTGLPYYECENRYVTGRSDCVKRIEVDVLQEIILAFLCLELEKQKVIQKKEKAFQWNDATLQHNNKLQRKRECIRLQQDMRYAYEDYRNNNSEGSIAQIKQLRQEMDYIEKQSVNTFKETGGTPVQYAGSFFYEGSTFYEGLRAVCITEILVWTDSRIEIHVAFQEPKVISKITSTSCERSVF